MPIVWCSINNPMTLPLILAVKKLMVIGTFVSSFADGCLPTNASKMIDDLVFQDSHQPGTLRSPSLKVFIRLQRRKKCLLYSIFSHVIVAQPEDGVLEKIVAVIV